MYDYLTLILNFVKISLLVEKFLKGE